jgi:arylsulfatase A-like enzyme
MLYPRINRKMNLIFMLSALTLLCVMAQMSFLFIHHQVFDLFDSLAKNSLSANLTQRIILFPILFFIGVQIIIYALLVAWIVFQAFSIGKLCHLPKGQIYGLGIALWLITVATLLIVNQQWYPHSFFSQRPVTPVLLYLFLPLLFVSFLLTFFNFFLHRHYKIVGSIFLFILFSVLILAWQDHHIILNSQDYSTRTKPNIIFISIDSGRPDFINSGDTPTLDHLRKTSTTFVNAYTPLARSFPAWISILTGRHPKHHHARANLIHPKDLDIKQTLPFQLKQLGYQTIYGADETRFANITKVYGFDQLIGTKGSAIEFLLTSLNDSPLTNLLVNSPIGRYLFPYSYANRAAFITYQPDQFLHLVKQNLAARREQKPLFLALHLCLAHWPFTWADSHLTEEDDMPNQYKNALKKEDSEVKKLMALLKQAGLLNNTIFVLLSDHGTALGLPGDRFIQQKNYYGNLAFLKWITRYPLSHSEKISLSFDKDFPLNTSYGQGTDILSLSQYRVLLSFKRYGAPWPARSIFSASSLLDIAPTILDLLNQPLNQPLDGMSLKPELFAQKTKSQNPPRFLFLETGDKIAEIETDKINVNQVIKKRAAAYQIDSLGHLYLSQKAIHSIVSNKQQAVLYGDWLLARFPTQQIMTSKIEGRSLFIIPKTIPPYFVLVNLKTGKWEIKQSLWFKQTKSLLLAKKLSQFYQNDWQAAHHF